MYSSVPFLLECVLVRLFRDDHYYRIHSERSKLFAEKEAVENAYQALLGDLRALQAKYDDAISERDDALTQLREASRENSFKRNDKSDAFIKAEIDGLRIEL
jgi:protein HOOK3